MTKKFAAAAFAAILTGAVAFHGAVAQVSGPAYSDAEIAEMVAVQTKSASIHLEMVLEERPMPFAAKLASLENAQAGRPRLADDSRGEAQVIVLASAE